MDTCKNCGAEIKHSAADCPDCGQTGGGQTITDLPGAHTKEGRKTLFGEIKDKTPMEGDEGELGASGGGQTITDLPKVHLREAHRKLKEEIKEAREKDREEQRKKNR
jgi:hypothetical protein